MDQPEEQHFEFIGIEPQYDFVVSQKKDEVQIDDACVNTLKHICICGQCDETKEIEKPKYPQYNLHGKVKKGGVRQLLMDKRKPVTFAYNRADHFAETLNKVRGSHPIKLSENDYAKMIELMKPFGMSNKLNNADDEIETEQSESEDESDTEELPDLEISQPQDFENVSDFTESDEDDMPELESSEPQNLENVEDAEIDTESEDESDEEIKKETAHAIDFASLYPSTLPFIKNALPFVENVLNNEETKQDMVDKMNLMPDDEIDEMRDTVDSVMKGMFGKSVQDMMKELYPDGNIDNALDKQMEKIPMFGFMAPLMKKLLSEKKIEHPKQKEQSSDIDKNSISI